MESLILKPDYEQILNKAAENQAKHRESSSLIKKSDTTGVSSLKSESKSSLHSSLASTALPAMSKSYNSASLGEMTPARRAKLAEVENTTISRQRGELQLLLAELRERDRELNSMVEAHTKQLAAWERDRNTVRNLEQRCDQLQGEICSKNDEIRALTSRLRLADAEDSNKATAIKNSQQQMVAMTEKQSHMQMDMEDLQNQIEVITQQHSLSAMEVQELEEKNRSLMRSIMDLNTTIGQFDAREQELITVLKLKDKDMSESCSRMTELSSRLQKQETSLEKSRRGESDLRRTASEWKNKYDHLWKEYDHCKRVLRTSDQKNGEQQAELQRLKQEMPNLRKEHILSSEREKRRSDMLELEQSRSARMELELSNLRDLCERQQRDLAVLEQNLHNTRDIVSTQQQRILNQRQVDTNICRPSGQSNNSYTRSRSPASRSPTRSRTRSPGRFSSSPDRLQSRVGNLSPSKLRPRSPDVMTSSYRAKSPVQRAKSPAQRTKSPVQRNSSPDRYRYTSQSYLPSKENGCSKEGGDIPEMDSTGYYTHLYTSSSNYKYDTKTQKNGTGEEDLPYKTYSADQYKTQRNVTGEEDLPYKTQNWSTTKALSHAADDIINKYYPLKDVALPEPRRSSMEEREDSSQVSTPRGRVVMQGVSLNKEGDGGEQAGKTWQSDQEQQNQGSVQNQGAMHFDQGSVHSNQGSVHTNQGSVHSHQGSVHSNQGSVHSNQGSVHSHQGSVRSIQGPVHSHQGSVHSIQGSVHSIQGSVHSNQGSVHSNQGSVHSNQISHHSDQESLHSSHTGHESDHSDQGSRHSTSGSVQLPERNSMHQLADGAGSAPDFGESSAMRESWGRQEDDMKSISSSSSFNISIRSSEPQGFPSVQQQLTPGDSLTNRTNSSNRSPPVDDTAGLQSNGSMPRAQSEERSEARSNLSMPGSRFGEKSEVRSDQGSVHSATGKSATAQVSADQDVDDLFAFTKPSESATLLKQHTQQTETGELDLEDILRESREVAEQLEHSSQVSGTPGAQNGHADFLEDFK